MNPWQVDPLLSCIGIGLLIVTNIILWVFAYGRRTGTQNTKIKGIEKELDERGILPECRGIFSEIKENLTEVTTEIKFIAKKVETNVEVRDKVMELSGKVEAIFVIIVENQKNIERERTRPGATEGRG